jgi:pimeloyl-ACP methyl ester carboxylesterase
MNPSGKSWPEMMGKDDAFRDFRIATYRYDSPLLGQSSTPQEISTRMLRQLEDNDIFRQYDEIYFLTHSMGGLVTKRVPVNLNKHDGIEKLPRIKAVIYIATPAQGTEIADLGALLSLNPQFRTMQSADFNAYLQNLEDEWANLMRQRTPSQFPQSFCAYETKPLVGRIIVSRTRATTHCDDNAIAFDEDHISIVKPSSEQSDVYTWARKRILESSVLAQGGPNPTYALWRTPYNYKVGIIVNGVEWKEGFREYEFSARNPSKTESFVDLRLRFDFPWAVVLAQIDDQRGLEGLTLSRSDSSFKVGNERQINSIVPSRTNVLEMSVRTMFPESVLRGTVILNTSGILAENTVLHMSYRDKAWINKRSFLYRISVIDPETGSVKIDPTPLKGTHKSTIILQPHEPIPFKGR